MQRVKDNIKQESAFQLKLGKLTTHMLKVSCWADDVGHVREECTQQQLIIRLGHTKALFKGFIHWLLRDKLNGFTLVAHNDAGFDNHYLFHYLINDFGITVDPFYSGSKLLQFTVKKSTKDKDYTMQQKFFYVEVGTFSGVIFGC